MSKELLRQIGENWFGEQWQAPFAREISVSERSLRRWISGEDPIPEGVWRDVILRLETRESYARYFKGEVSAMLGRVEVHAFEVWDHGAGQNIPSEGKSTIERIQRIGGAPIAGTSEWVSSNSVVEGRFLQNGSQTIVGTQPRRTSVPSDWLQMIGIHSGWTAAQAITLPGQGGPLIEFSYRDRAPIALPLGALLRVTREHPEWDIPSMVIQAMDDAIQRRVIARR